MTFSERLYFTSANEDGATELAALGPLRSRILCLTGSGARALDLLAGDPDEIVAIDLNRAQCELLRLKIAAFRALPDNLLCAYLGVEACDDRLALHAEVEFCLTPDSRLFWRERQNLIARGVWYAGLWEKVLRFGARLNGLVRGRAIARLLAAPTIEEQQKIWAKDFDDRLWHFAIRLLSRRIIWSYIVGEPGGAFLPSPDQVEVLLAGSFRDAAGRFFFRDSDFACLILRGRHTLNALPLHLRPENHAMIRARLDRVTIRQASLADLSPETHGTFDAFSLSDFGSYCDGAAYAACWRSVASVARPEARVCERVFLHRPAPSGQVNWDETLSRELTARDTSFIYEIRAGHMR